MKTVYKVVRTVKPPIYCSLFSHGTTLNYKLSEPTIAPYNSLLFCFTNLESVKRYIKYDLCNIRYPVLLCSTDETPMDIKYRLTSINNREDKFNSFWSFILNGKKPQFSNWLPTPTGTVGVRTLTPIEKVTID